MKQRLLSLVLALCLLSACGAAFAEGAQDMPVIRFFGHGSVSGIVETEYTNILYDKIGCKIDVTLVADGNEYSNVLATIIASQDLPDFFEAAYDTRKTLYEYGALLPLTDLLNEYGQNVLQAKGPYLGGGMSYQGEIYGITTTSLVVPEITCIRTDWLEKLGLDIPRTLEEVYDVAYAFTFDDPDGNGIDDTYGFGTCSSTLSPTLMAAFGVNVAAYNLVDEKVVPYFMHPNFLEAMKFVNRLYNDGIMEPDFATISWSDGGANWSAGKYGIYGNAAVSATLAKSWLGTLRKSYPEANAVAFLIEGPDGAVGTPGTNITTTWATLLSADTKFGVEIIKMFDWLATDEGNMWQLAGIEGTTYQWTDDTKTTFEYLGDADERKALGMGFIGWTNGRMQYEPNGWSKEMIEGNQLALDHLIDAANLYEKLPIEEQLGNTLSSLMNEGSAEMVVCAPDEIEEIYRNYVEMYLSSGGQDWIDQATEAYNAAA